MHNMSPLSFRPPPYPSAGCTGSSRWPQQRVASWWCCCCCWCCSPFTLFFSHLKWTEEALKPTHIHTHTWRSTHTVTAGIKTPEVCHYSKCQNSSLLECGSLLLMLVLQSMCVCDMITCNLFLSFLLVTSWAPLHVCSEADHPCMDSQ